MPYVVRDMRLTDIDQVARVERQCFTTPWSSSAYRREVQDNRLGRYIVLTWEEEEGPDEPVQSEQEDPSEEARLSGVRRAVGSILRPFSRVPSATTVQNSTVAGFAGLWYTLDEGHITTICVHPMLQGHGLGELLFTNIIQLSKDMGAERITLEVRVSNLVAQDLYRKYGFTTEGTRRRYYSDNNEDALIMWSESLDSEAFTERFARLRRLLDERLLNTPPPRPSWPPNRRNQRQMG